MAWDNDSWKDSYDAWKLASPDDERADDECHHEEFEIDLEGRARCDECGETWWASDDEIAHQRCMNETYDRYCRQMERRQRWREHWIKWVLVPTLPLRMWLQGVAWRAFPKRRRINRFLSVDDKIPF